MSDSVQSNYLLEYTGPRVSRDCFHVISDWFLSTMRLACGDTVVVSENLEFTSQAKLSTIRRLFLVIIVCVTTVPFVLVGLVFQLLSPSRKAMYQHYLFYQEHSHLCTSTVDEVVKAFTQKQGDPEAWRNLFSFCCQMSFKKPKDGEIDFNAVLENLAARPQEELQPLIDAINVDISSLNATFLAQIALFAQRHYNHNPLSLQKAQKELLTRYENRKLTNLRDEDLRYVLGGLPREEVVQAKELKERLIKNLNITSATQLLILWEEIFRFRKIIPTVAPSSPSSVTGSDLPNTFFSTLVHLFFENQSRFRKENREKLLDLMKLPDVARLSSGQLGFLIALAKVMNLSDNLFDLLLMMKNTKDKESVPKVLHEHSLCTWQILKDLICAYPDSGDSLQDLVEFFPQLDHVPAFDALPPNLQEKIRNAHQLQNSQQA